MSLPSTAQRAVLRDAVEAEGWPSHYVHGKTAYIGHLRVKSTAAGFTVSFVGASPLATYTLAEPAVIHASHLWQELSGWLEDLAVQARYLVAPRRDHFLVLPSNGWAPQRDRRVQVSFDGTAARLHIASRIWFFHGDMSDRNIRQAA